MDAETVRTIRTDLGFTQTEFAAEIGLTGKYGYVTVSGWELGRKRVSEANAMKIERLAGLKSVCPTCGKS